MTALVTVYRTTEAEVGRDGAGRVAWYMSPDYARHVARMLRAMTPGQVDGWAGDTPVADALEQAATRVGGR